MRLYSSYGLLGDSAKQLPFAFTDVQEAVSGTVDIGWKMLSSKFDILFHNFFDHINFKIKLATVATSKHCRQKKQQESKKTTQDQ
jgi:hypothetical protein